MPSLRPIDFEEVQSHLQRAGAADAEGAHDEAGSALVAARDALEPLMSQQRRRADALAAFGRAWLGLLPYAALAGVVTALASSSVAGISAAIGYLFTEWPVAALLLSRFDWAQDVAD